MLYQEYFLEALLKEAQIKIYIDWDKNVIMQMRILL